MNLPLPFARLEWSYNYVSLTRYKCIIIIHTVPVNKKRRSCYFYDRNITLTQPYKYPPILLNYNKQQ